ncbi:thiol-activated cytolysin family protein [Cryomorphaceae bacterium 1068]|nr:thiol-activated cytolysin family protein [Cryomorphaceae bacterium 1068]
MKKFVLFLVLIAVVVSCKKDDDDDNGPSPSTTATGDLGEIINGAGGFDFELTDTQVVETTVESDSLGQDGTYWSCTTQVVEFGSNPGLSSDFALMAPNEAVIYPGSLLQGNTVGEPTPSAIVLPRGRGNVRISGNSGFSLTNVDVEPANGISIGDGMNQIIAGATTDQLDVTANTDFQFQRIYSEEHLAATLGFKYKGPSVNVTGSLSYSQDESKSNILVSVKQSFYTMIFDLKDENGDVSADGSDFFGSSVTAAQLGEWIEPGNPGCYVKQVTYGRIFYMLISSSSSHAEMEAALSAKWNGWVSSGQVDASVSLSNSLQELNISVQAYGGGLTENAFATSADQALEDLGEALVNTTSFGTGAPISYVVNEIANPTQTVATQLNLSYTITDCTPYAEGFPEFAVNWSQINEVAGNVTAMYQDDDNTLIAFIGDGTQYVRVEQNGPDNVVEGPFNMDQLFPADANGETISNSISSVQAIGRWRDLTPAVGDITDIGVIAYGNGGEHVIYVPSDNTYKSADQGNTGLGLPRTIGGTVPGGSFGGGIGAIYNNRGQLGGNDFQHTFFSPDGLSRVNYNTAAIGWGDVYEPVESISNWSNQISSTFGAVGASARYSFGGQMFEIVANGEGTLYMIRGIQDGLNDWKGPFPF